MAITKPKGIITFNPHPNAPNFVLGTIAISLNQLKDWCETDGAQYLTDYKGEPQLKLQVTSLKEGRGIMIAVDTYKKESAPKQTGTTTRSGITTEDGDGLPFLLFALLSLGSILQFVI